MLHGLCLHNSTKFAQSCPLLFRILPATSNCFDSILGIYSSIILLSKCSKLLSYSVVWVLWWLCLSEKEIHVSWKYFVPKQWRLLLCLLCEEFWKSDLSTEKWFLAIFFLAKCNAFISQASSQRERRQWDQEMAQATCVLSIKVAVLNSFWRILPNFHALSALCIL